jgi:selenocysteine-specific elongation factor
MSQPTLTLGTAGHIDHGKTTLVEALTGINTDRLPQERARGISIELGFARLALPSGRSLSVVDVPGHERFVRTMVAGATGIDLFLLVVAADDGVMPQTREHLAVLALLGVPVGAVALTKADLVDAALLEAAVAEVSELLASGPYRGAPVVAVSAARGTGLGELTGVLDGMAAHAPPRAARAGPARMHVDRCFTLKGIGTVVTGTLWSGALAEGDEVRIEPSAARARIRSVHVHDERQPAAAAGSRVALNLAGIERAEVARGDVVVTPGAELAATYLVDAGIELLEGVRPLRSGARVQVHHGTREVAARVALLDADVLEPAQRCLAQLRVERPLVPAAGDRVVLRGVAPPQTIGGGTVIDAHPRKHGPGAAHVRRLRAIEQDDPLEALRIELEGARSGLGPEAGQPLLAELEARGAAQRIGAATLRWFDSGRLQRARRDLLEALASAPPGRGVGAGALAEMAVLQAPAVSALLEQLAAEDRVSERGGVFTLPAQPALDPVAGRLAELVHADRLSPRAPDALAEAAGVTRADALRVLDALVGRGLLERLRPGVYFAPEALAEARSAVVSACEREGSVTIAGLRDALGTSRKYAQAILEYLDGARVTRRVGDHHVLRSRR